MKKPKVVIIGWDGATFDVALPLIEQGRMPNLKRMMERGSYGKLRSTYPPITPAAWISFMLGMGQGGHGVFNFTKPDLRVPGQDFAIENGKSVCRGNTFWEYMEGKDGTRSALLFVPMTYPVWKTNGIMVAGNPIGSMSKGLTHPADLATAYGGCFFPADYYKLHTSNRSEYLSHSYNIIEERAGKLWEVIDGPYDVVFMVFDATDAVTHTFWKFREPERFQTDPVEQELYADAVDQHYISVDQKLGEMFERLGDDTLVVLLSDHGGGATAFRNFHMNRWLKDEGFLVDRKKVGKSLMRRIGRWIHWNRYLRKYWRALPGFVHAKANKVSSNLDALDFSKTLAFRVPMQFYFDGIEINLKSRQVEGIVEEADYDGLCDEIIGRLLDITDPDTGEKVVVWAKKKEELLDGEGSKYGPDIFVEFYPRYMGASDTEQLVSDAPTEQIQNMSGCHRMYGMFGFLGNQIAANNKVEGAAIEDLTPTILHALGYTVPGYMTGKILEDVYKRDFMTKNPVKYNDEKYRRPGDKVSVSETEEEKMRDQLRGLGYME